MGTFVALTAFFFALSQVGEDPYTWAADLAFSAGWSAFVMGLAVLGFAPRGPRHLHMDENDMKL
jgi:hypothetical protein